MRNSFHKFSLVLLVLICADFYLTDDSFISLLSTKIILYKLGTVFSIGFLAIATKPPNKDE